MVTMTRSRRGGNGDRALMCMWLVSRRQAAARGRCGAVDLQSAFLSKIMSCARAMARRICRRRARPRAGKREMADGIGERGILGRQQYRRMAHQSQYL